MVSAGAAPPAACFSVHIPPVVSSKCVHAAAVKLHDELRELYGIGRRWPHQGAVACRTLAADVEIYETYYLLVRAAEAEEIFRLKICTTFHNFRLT